MKTFFGDIFIEKEKLEKEGKNYPVKLEYYKTINKDELSKENDKIFGIQVVKMEYKAKIKTEKKELNYLTNNEEKIEKILEIFRRNQVTPIEMSDIIEDLAISQQI